MRNDAAKRLYAGYRLGDNVPGRTMMMMMMTRRQQQTLSLALGRAYVCFLCLNALFFFCFCCFVALLPLPLPRSSLAEPAKPAASPTPLMAST